MLKVINKETFKDIEELSDVNTYLANLGTQQLAKIKNLISDAMSKMTLLENYNCKMVDEEFSRTWRSFSKPLEIFKAEAECKKRMKTDEKEFF